ncbi:hypothetical protein F5Y18DRAFT_441737 [Xylariaceae sp. FL1019]|nr:hypothetical protein F5Y18DRAFT_441737 [Xylariaceae sp. FL1019]
MDAAVPNPFGDADPVLAHLAGKDWAEAGVVITPERWSQIHRQWLTAQVQIDGDNNLIAFTAAQIAELGQDMDGLHGPGYWYFIEQYRKRIGYFQPDVDFWVDGRTGSNGRVYLGPLPAVEERVGGNATRIHNDLGLIVIVPNIEFRTEEEITADINSYIPNRPMAAMFPNPQIARQPAPGGQDDGAPPLEESLKGPRNSWILYRTYRQRFLRAERPGIQNHEVSTIAGAEWKNENKAPWVEMAEAEARVHSQIFPDYKKGSKTFVDRSTQQGRDALQAYQDYQATHVHPPGYAKPPDIIPSQRKKRKH